MHSFLLRKRFIIVLFKIVPRGHVLPCAAPLSQKQPQYLLWTESKTPLESHRKHSPAAVPLSGFLRGLSVHPAGAMPTMRPHKKKLATGVWPLCLQALLTFWGLFVSLGGDTGSEAEEMTGGLYKNWLPAPTAIRFLHCFSWKILQKDSFKMLIALRGYIIASIQISDYLNFLQNHQSPIPGLGERRGWEDLKFLSLAADSWLLRKARCQRLDTFPDPFHWLRTWVNALGSLVDEHRDTNLRGETSSGKGFILQARMNLSSFQRGHQQAGKDMPLKWAQTDCL